MNWIWLLIAVPGFWTVEIGAEPEWDQFYLTTEARLEKRSGRDWY